MKTKLMLIAIFLSGVQILFAQSAPIPERSYKISGKVIDHTNNTPLEYATVRIMSAANMAYVTGSATNADGLFEIKIDQTGTFVAEIHFIGFEKKQITITIDEKTHHKDIGTVKLSPATHDIEAVSVKANRHAVEYKIDKKVLHVDKQITAISGTAVDVLQNAPSVQVDIEGNVSLRGNSNFTVLIDGRPTVLDATEALEQIPASMIQDIEIITNPSAKYDPEGTAGIINIVTKKRSLEGISGTVGLNIGLDHKYGADLLLNFRNKHFNFFVAADYNDRQYPGSMQTNTVFYGQPDFFLEALGDRNRGRKSYSARTGVEWFISDKTSVTLSARYGNRGASWKTETAYKQWYDGDNNAQQYLSMEDGARGGDFYSTSLDFQHLFTSVNHKIDGNIMYFSREGNDETINFLFDAQNQISDGQKSGEYGPATGVRYRFNYAQPFSKAFEIETGIQGRYRDAQEDNQIFYYNTATQQFDFQTQYSHNVNYLRSIHAAYGLTKGQINSFGYQVGLRAEYTFRDIILNDLNKNFNINRWDFFPTAHFSYQYNDKQQFMASYSKRIDRPRGWFLEPFETWTDAYNVRSGNPDLKPEYIDAYEIGYQTNFGQHALTAELYYRTTKNKIERIRTTWPDEEGVILQSFENVGTDYATGLELVLNLLPVKWWEADMTANFYDYRVEGTLNDVVFDESSFTWSLRMNNSFKLGKKTSLQINPFYRAPEVEPQEKEEGYFRVDGAIRHNLFENKMRVTLQLSDIFASGKWEATTETPDLRSYRLYTHRAPIVMLNINWRINNYKDRKSGDKPENQGGGMEGGEM